MNGDKPEYITKIEEGATELKLSGAAMRRRYLLWWIWYFITVNDIGDKSTKAIAEALKANASLTKLDIESSTAHKGTACG